MKRTNPTMNCTLGLISTWRMRKVFCRDAKAMLLITGWWNTLWIWIFFIIKIGQKMSIIIILFKIRFFGFQKWQNDDRFLNNETIFGVTSGEGAAICVLSGEDQKWALPTNQLPPPLRNFLSPKLGGGGSLSSFSKSRDSFLNWKSCWSKCALN